MLARGILRDRQHQTRTDDVLVAVCRHISAHRCEKQSDYSVDGRCWVCKGPTRVAAAQHEHTCISLGDQFMHDAPVMSKIQQKFG